MRIFTASLATETNTFSPLPTDLESFHSGFYAAAGEHPETPTLCSAVIPVLRKRQRSEGFELIEGSASWAEPGGYVRLDVYEALRDEILDQLKVAMPVDCVILGLHGAMVSRGLDDCEGDLLAKIRDIIGPDVILAAELDPHSHMTKLRVQVSDILASFLEFPHIDFVERAEHVVDLALAATRKEIHPVMSIYDCKMIDIFPTSREPMRSFVNRMKSCEKHDKILSVSLIHGFTAADVAEFGTFVLVISNGNKAIGDALASELGAEVFGLRGTTVMDSITPAQAIKRANASKNYTRPVVIADMWDNPGGGMAGDNTFLLNLLIAESINSAALATIWDPMAVRIAFAAGLGVAIDMRIGGKTGPASGLPFDGMFEIINLSDNAWQSFGDSKVDLGKSAVLRLVGTEIDIVINTKRTQVFEPNIFSNLGINPKKKKVLIVKSTNHFYSGFEPIADQIIYAALTDGYKHDPRKTEYKKMKRKIWPIVRDPA